MDDHIELEGLIESRNGVPIREYRVVFRPITPGFCPGAIVLQSRSHYMAEYAYGGDGIFTPDGPPRDSYQWSDHRKPLWPDLVARLLVYANRIEATAHSGSNPVADNPK